jgi:hypothetical protein
MGLILVGALPAMIGGIGYLYVPMAAAIGVSASSKLGDRLT